MSSTLFTRPVAPGWRRWLPMLALAFAALGASAEPEEQDPPGRVAAVTERAGSVVYAPAGEDEWGALPQNRPLTQADRLWTDRGAKVELHLGTETVHVRDLTNLGIVELDDNATHLSLTQGSINARVREMQAGERFMVGTPNLSARASQAGDFRIDVDPDTASTRVAVHSGTVTVYGEDGKGRVIGPGEDVMFVARDLEQVEPGQRNADAFDQWVTARNQREQRSPTAQYVPHEVVGATQLDNHGVWQQDTTYGAVWYPTVITSEWAPYRQGHWEWIRPWGWTWIDDAPWGFAPFHYGRWAMIGSRWAWVPGSLGRRPVYSPALVTFVGGSGVNFYVANSPGVAWYPLGPGEAWRPAFRASPVYVRNVNRNFYASPRGSVYVNNRHANAITSVRLDDFTRGRPVWGNWHHVDPARLAGAAVVATPAARPNWSRGDRQSAVPVAPRLVQAPPAAVTVPRIGFGARSVTAVPQPAMASPQPTITSTQPGWVSNRAQRDATPERVQREGQVRGQQRDSAPRVQQDNAVRLQNEAAIRQQRETARQQWQLQHSQHVEQRQAHRPQQVQAVPQQQVQAVPQAQAVPQVQPPQPAAQAAPGMAPRAGEQGPQDERGRGWRR